MFPGMEGDNGRLYNTFERESLRPDIYFRHPFALALVPYSDDLIRLSPHKL